MASFKEQLREEQRQNLAKYYKTSPENITDKDIDTYKKESNKSMKRGLGAGAALTAGQQIIKNTAPKGYISGRRKLYHSTEASNVNKIKKEGLKAFGKNDANAAFTNAVLYQGRKFGLIKDEPDKALYMGKNKTVAKSSGKMKRKSIYSGGKHKVLTASIPYDEYKKLKHVDNPELLGAKSLRQYVKTHRDLDTKVKEALGGKGKAKVNIIDDVVRAGSYGFVGKNTKVLPHDLSTKYIKGAEGYVKNSPKEVLRYMKKHPTRLLKGLGAYGLGGATLAGGVKLINDNRKTANKLRSLEELRKRENNKQASAVLDKMYMEKTAGSIGDFVNDIKDAFTPKQPANPNPQQGVKFNPDNQTPNDIKKYIQNNYNASRDFYSNELGIDNPKYLHDDSFINALDAAEQKYGKGFMDYYGDDFYNSVENSLLPKQNKQASDILNDMYMEKQADVMQTLRKTGKKVKAKTLGRYVDLLRGDTLLKNKATREGTRNLLNELNDKRDSLGKTINELQQNYNKANEEYRALDKSLNKLKKHNNLDALKQEIGNTKQVVTRAEHDLKDMQNSFGDFLNQKTKDKFIKSYQIDLDNANKAHNEAKQNFANAKNDFFAKQNTLKSQLDQANKEIEAQRAMLKDKRQEVNGLITNIDKTNNKLKKDNRAYGAENAKHLMTLGGTIGATVYGIDKGKNAIYDKIKGKEGGK